MKTKAFAYLRVSTDGQTKDGKDGFPRQEQAIQDYAKAHNLEITDIFRDGITGTSDDRPALAEMLVSMEKNGHEVRTVIIERLDRLARDLMIQEAIIRDFQKNSFQLISTTEGTDLGSDDPSRKLIRQIFGAVSEFDKTMLVMKLKAARERKRKLTGKCQGRKGYHEELPDVIKYIRQLRRKPKYRKQLTYQQIADRLNDEGVITMDGRPWTLHRVNQVLHCTTKNRVL